ncbi:MAG: DUF3386 family protein [Planctomycetia bacterium]|nr:DUF3386 family protein [Planctomycetia bacterium]
MRLCTFAGPWFSALFVSALLGASPARAHFIWVVLESKSDGAATAHVYFSETPSPGEAHLVDRAARAKVFLRESGGKGAPVELKAATQGDVGELCCEVKPAGAACLEATCKYGVITRGEKSSLLHYYAKCLEYSPAALRDLGRSESLPLDIVPHAKGQGLELEVLWQGKPAAGSQVVVIDPSGESSELKAGDDGRVTIETLRPGKYAARARVVVDKPGTDDGEEYAQELHYSTLVLVVPEQAAAVEKLTAAQMLRAAREGRAVWNDFPGFESDVTLYESGKTQKGRLVVSADGEVKLAAFELAKDSRVEATLRSLVGHRLPGGETSDDVSFADEKTDHPLGRLIKLDYDSQMASAYRIRDDVIHEVNRQLEGGGRFTISVFEVHRNAEGKYLPQTYTVSFWNKDGTLRSTSVTQERWVRVSAFDLPKSHDSVTTGKDQHANVRMEFSNHKLLTK